MKLTILMEPVAKGRARTVRRGEKIMTFTPGKTVHAENLIREQLSRLQEFYPAGTPLYLTATFYRSRPKSLKKGVLLPVTRPDLDNCAKLLTDAMNAFAYADDSQITTALIKKRFGSPRTEVSLEVDHLESEFDL